jgi:signal peptidase I
MASRCPAGALPEFFDEESMRYFKQFEEQLGVSKPHRLLNDDDRPPSSWAPPLSLPENCRYSVEGVVQGARRPLLHDGRQPRQFAGFALLGLCAGRNIVGKAFFVWMNFGNFKRIGSFN